MNGGSTYRDFTVRVHENSGVRVYRERRVIFPSGKTLSSKKMQAPFNLIRDITVNVPVPSGVSILKHSADRARLLVHGDRVSWVCGCIAQPFLRHRSSGRDAPPVLGFNSPRD